MSNLKVTQSIIDERLKEIKTNIGTITLYSKVSQNGAYISAVAGSTGALNYVLEPNEASLKIVAGGILSTVLFTYLTIRNSHKLAKLNDYKTKKLNKSQEEINSISPKKSSSNNYESTSVEEQGYVKTL